MGNWVGKPMELAMLCIWKGRGGLAGKFGHRLVNGCEVK